MKKKERIKLFGLIGRNIDYSFSRKYFTEKFKKNNLNDCIYLNFDLKEINDFNKIINKNRSLKGLNVTIPYKKTIIPFLDELSDEARAINAVNTIVFESSGRKIGHNTDYLGFDKALKEIDLIPSIIENRGQSGIPLGFYNKIGYIKKLIC